MPNHPIYYVGVLKNNNYYLRKSVPKHGGGAYLFAFIDWGSCDIVSCIGKHCILTKVGKDLCDFSNKIFLQSHHIVGGSCWHAWFGEKEWLLRYEPKAMVVG